MESKVAIVMVGLPARGKTYVARKLARYLNWLGRRTRVVNAGDYRRRLLGLQQTHEFFRPENAEGRAARLAVAKAALEDLFSWLRVDGEVAIYDATNTTRARRDLARQLCEGAGTTPLFVEVICTDDADVEATIRETKISSPDYATLSSEEAVRDFRNRIAHYESTYEPVGEDEGSYIKYIDKGEKLICRGVELDSQLVRFLLNLRGIRKSTWLTRHGESLWNCSSLIGGDPDLSPAGYAFASRLADLVHQRAIMQDVVVWTSTLKRTLQTARGIAREHRVFRELDEINAGICEGMSYAEIREKLPEEADARARDKFRYRYPSGESYQDLIERLVPVVLAYERETRPLLVVGHQAVLRAFYAYLMGIDPERCPHLSIPLHTLIELSPRIYDYSEERIALA
jgi:broad specificity phosphatase PhoE/predicted kinase